MIRYWMLISAGARITARSKYYKVAVSDSAQGQRDLLAIRDFCHSRGYYCHVWDNEAVEFLSRIAVSLGKSCIQLSVMYFSAAILVKSIKQHSMLPQSQLLTPQAAKILELFDPRPAMLQRINVLLSAEAGTREKPKSREADNKGQLVKKAISIPADGKQD